MQSPHAGPLPGSYWVRPGRLLAGSYPSSAFDPTLTQERLARLLDAGVTFFLDLTEPGERELYMPFLPEGVEHQRFAIPDMHTPDHALMSMILDTIDTILDDGRTIYLHCWGGIGRTGTVAGCYLVRHGMTGQEALAEIARRRHAGSPETDEQRWMVEHWREDS